MAASLPPSSSAHGMSRVAQATATFRPVPTLPVKKILSTGASQSAPPVAPLPWSTANKSRGSPASSSSSPSSAPEVGVSSDGLSSTAFPVTSAGSAIAAESMNG